MADTEDEVEIVAEPAAGSSKRKVIILAFLVLLVLVGGGAGAFFYLTSSSETDMASTEPGGDGETNSGGLFSSGRELAIYHRLRPNFITTFEANSKQRYVQMEVTLVTRKEEVISALVTHKPLIRNALVLVIDKQNYLELQTFAGKEKLRQAALLAVQDVLKQEIGSAGVEKVLFTKFVMQ